MPDKARRMNERNLLEAAQSGDEDAFGRLVTPHRAELHAHCYRMLGSVPDAEDALQEVLLAAWRGLPRFEGRSSLRSWLYRIATNTCLKAIERRPKRVLPIDYGPAADPHDGPSEPLVESVWVGPYPDETLGLADGLAGPDARYEQRESVELAFVAALQHLPARQRAVLILREVLGFSGREVAEALDSTPASVYSALQRAHKTVDERLPERSQQDTLRSLGDERVRRIAADYVDAWERSDVDAVVAMLAEDAIIAMPPAASWYHGRDAVATFLRARPLAQEWRWRLLPTRANGQLAFGHYILDPGKRRFVPHGVNVLTMRGARIDEIIAFLTPEAFEYFGLPEEIEP
jgi:RNA polymerase sigma-70 factor, ECF subfamily